jgi:hypothetical protein
MTPAIYKLAYMNNILSYVLFQNDGNMDVVLKEFETEAELLRYIETVFEKVGEITDYGLYIRKNVYDLTK